MIRSVKDYIKANKIVSLKDLSLHFNIDKGAVADMIQMLIRKELIEEIKGSSACSSCNSTCAFKCEIFYKWISSHNRSS